MKTVRSLVVLFVIAFLPLLIGGLLLLGIFGAFYLATYLLVSFPILAVSVLLGLAWLLGLVLLSITIDDR